jgi:hypothetical protein
MGTQARWFRSRYRYRYEPERGWTHADSLSDIRTDLEQLTPRPRVVQVQRRVREDDYADAGALVLSRRGKYRRQLPGRSASIPGEELDCHQCGGPMMLTDTGISHHLLPGSDGIDWDRDLDHVAYHTED